MDKLDLAKINAVDETEYESIDEIVKLISDLVEKYPWYPSYAIDAHVFESILYQIQEGSELPWDMLGDYRELVDEEFDPENPIIKCEACGSPNTEITGGEFRVGNRVDYKCNDCGNTWNVRWN
ncbi:MAG TPA: hypothetical protein VKM55_30910 [Candidatus Lokiarchaeia archaeon]|nr:hypothetical protein [Candidatus Lokiarchaeia archaeon]